MPPSSRIPPLLQPHVRLPRSDSILLLTSTLGANANWLIVRFLCDALNYSNHAGAATTQAESEGASRSNDHAGEEGFNVVLVSWMREYEFWRQEARKGGGLDLERLRREGRFALVDGLGGLFLEGDTMKEEETKKIPVARGQQQVFPVRGAPGAPLGRMSAVPARDPPAPASTATTAPAPTPTLGLFTLRSSSLAHLESTIHSAIAHLASSPKTPRKTLLILDNPDILLATSPSLSPSSLTSLILNLHTQPNVSHVLVHLQADTPLLGLSTPPQPLEVAQRNMVVKTAHMSRRVLGVRVLDTGVARDVSGVLRVTGNNGGWADLQVRGDDEEEADGREMLYKVNGDGSVKVFERGAGGDG